MKEVLIDLEWLEKQQHRYFLMAENAPDKEQKAVYTAHSNAYASVIAKTKKLKEG